MFLAKCRIELVCAPSDLHYFHVLLAPRVRCDGRCKFRSFSLVRMNPSDPTKEPRLGRHIRRSHPKSRHGCATCKRRRVKVRGPNIYLRFILTLILHSVMRHGQSVTTVAKEKKHASIMRLVPSLSQKIRHADQSERLLLIHKAPQCQRQRISTLRFGVQRAISVIMHLH